MAVSTSSDPGTLLTQLIGPSCHEMRSPLAVVYGFSKMLEKTDLGDPANEYVAQIVQGAQRIDFLLDVLSRAGRIASGRVRPAVADVAIGQLVEDVTSIPELADRISVSPGPLVDVRADRDWLADSILELAEAMTVEPDDHLRLAWRALDDRVDVDLRCAGEVPAVEADPAKAMLEVSLVRMRLLAMGGSLEPIDDGLVLTVPRSHV